MRIILRLPVRFCTVGVLILLSAGGALGGSLDRGAMPERYNGATKDMLRVPGVVGSYEQDALSLLQQSGLAVKIKRITKDLAKYEGQEGKVIGQNPMSGGLAMIGSTVTLTVYKKNEGYDGGHATPPAGTWGETEPPAGTWGETETPAGTWGETETPAGEGGFEPYSGEDESSYDGSWPSDSSGDGAPTSSGTTGEGEVTPAPAPGWRP